MKKNLILSVLFLLAIFASCSKETTYSITNATGSLIAVRVHEYDDKDKPIKIQEETVLTYIIHSGFISGYQNRYGDNLKPPTNVYHRMTA